MNVIFLFFFSNIIPSSIIQCVSFDIQKLPKNQNFNKKLYSLRNLNNDMNLIKLKSGLYTIKLLLGEHKQTFNLILDTGSCMCWVGDEKCENCPSRNLYSPYLSNYFTKTNVELNIGYTSGRLHGYVCEDILYINDSHHIPKFNFLLTDYAVINTKIDGIAGFMRKFTDDNTNYSIIHKLFQEKIIDNKFFVVDITNNNPNGNKFYIGEIPPYILKMINVICLNTDNELNKHRNKYWRCPGENYSFEGDEEKYEISSSILFDSGTNGIIIPKAQHKIFIKKVFAELLQESICTEVLHQEAIYQVQCYQDITNIIGLKLPSLLISINGEVLVIDILRLFNIENKEFDLYFCDNLQGWVFGIPFFEQYATLFDYDKNVVTIFLKNKEGFSFLGLKTIFWFLIFLILTCLLGGRAYIKRKMRLRSRETENFEKEISLVSPFVDN